MQPIQYLGDQQSPIQKFIAAKRIKLQQDQQNRQLDQADTQIQNQQDQRAVDNDLNQRRVGLAESQDARAVQSSEAQVAKAKETKAAIEQFAAKPNKSPKDYSEMIVKYPELSKDIKAAYDILSEDVQREQMQSASQIYAAVSAGRNDIAKDLLKERASAALSGGDQKTADGAKAMISIIDANPEAAKTSMGVFLASTVEGSKLADTLISLEGAQNKRDLHAGEVAKQNADLNAEAVKLGLTRAQTNKVMVETRKLGVETKKAVMEVEAIGKGGGVIADPEKRFNMEQKLRSEYNREVGTFTDTQDAYNRVKSAENTAVGDIALITSYMKMIDPGSTVREGEFATAQNAAGAGDKVRNTWNKIVSGERLTEGQRKEFKSQARALLDASKKRDTSVRNGLAPTIKRYGLDEQNIFYTKPEAEVAADKAENDPLGIRE